MLLNSRSNISAEMKRNVCIRIKPVCSNHGIGKIINIGWWLALNPLVCFR